MGRILPFYVYSPIHPQHILFFVFVPVMFPTLPWVGRTEEKTRGCLPSHAIVVALATSSKQTSLQPRWSWRMRMDTRRNSDFCCKQTTAGTSFGGVPFHRVSVDLFVLSVLITVPPKVSFLWLKCLPEQLKMTHDNPPKKIPWPIWQYDRLTHFTFTLHSAKYTIIDPT